MTIRCDLHDLLEIACLFHYPIQVSLRSGEAITGAAFDTATRADKKEYLVVKRDDSGSITDIPTEEIIQMTALKQNPHFDVVLFN